MQISEVFDLEHVDEESEVTIEGIFVMEHGVGYFVQSKDNMADKDRAVMVSYPGLEKLLLSRVPAYGGSKYSYCNDAVVTGILKISPLPDFSFTIGEMNNFIIYMYGESIVVVS